MWKFWYTTTTSFDLTFFKIIKSFLKLSSTFAAGFFLIVLEPIKRKIVLYYVEYLIYRLSWDNYACSRFILLRTYSLKMLNNISNTIVCSILCWYRGLSIDGNRWLRTFKSLIPLYNQCLSGKKRRSEFIYDYVVTVFECFEGISIRVSEKDCLNKSRDFLVDRLYLV